MQVKIFGKNNKTSNLIKKVNIILEEMGLNDFIKVESTNDLTLKEELNITKEPALIIEEEAIDFKDIIFEGIIPKKQELKSMFISIIGGDNNNQDCDINSCSNCLGC